MEDEKNEKNHQKRERKDMVNEEEENLNEIKEIFYLKNTDDGERYYLVEKEDGSLEKLRTGKVVRKYPIEFTTYLEGKIKEKLDKWFLYFVFVLIYKRGSKWKRKESSDWGSLACWPPQASPLDSSPLSVCH